MERFVLSVAFGIGLFLFLAWAAKQDRLAKEAKAALLAVQDEKRTAFAATLGLRYLARDGKKHPRLVGEFGGIPVVVEWLSVEAGKAGIIETTTVTAFGVPAGLALRREDFGTAVRQVLEGKDVQTLDEDFDRKVFLIATPVDAIGLCLPGIREPVLYGVDGLNAVVEFGKAVRTMQRHDTGRIEATLRGLTDLSRALAAMRHEIAPRLLECVRTGPPHLAVRALDQLLATEASSEETRDALKSELASEPRLVALLGGSEDPIVSAAAARVLGRTAGLSAVEVLLPLTKGILGGALKEAAREAIDAIQSRHAGGESGQLTVAEMPEAGRVTIADELPGAVSIAPATPKKQTT